MTPQPMLRRIPSLALAAVCLLAGLAGCVADFTNDVIRLDGYRAMRKGQHQQARKKFQQCLDHNPTDWKSLYYLGRLELNQFNNPAEARRHLEIAYTVRQNMADIQLSVDPGSAKTAVPSPSRHEIAAALAEALYRQGNTTQLFGFLRNAVDNYGTKKDYLLLARYLEKNGDHDAALVAFQQAAKVAASDDDATGFIELADFLDRRDRPDRALKALRKAYYVDPGARGLAQRIREHGMVPGPTIALPPDDEQPEAGSRGSGGSSASQPVGVSGSAGGTGASGTPGSSESSPSGGASDPSAGSESSGASETNGA